MLFYHVITKKSTSGRTYGGGLMQKNCVLFVHETGKNNKKQLFYFAKQVLHHRNIANFLLWS